MKPKILLLPLLIAANCCLIPMNRFEAYEAYPAPDYSQAKYWAGLPSTQDSADLVPKNSGLKENQAEALVDVFFVHPTTYYSGRSWNANCDDKRLNDFTDRTTIKHQASVFNATCRVYAPRYRQATLYSFLRTKGSGSRALALAYQDVKRAFEYYLENYNDGRPIVIASHSQGTWHTVKLLEEFFDADSILRKQLVCAYLIGGPVKIGSFRSIPPGDSATQTRCFVAWNTVAWQGKPRSDSLECVNPLTWRHDTIYARLDKNLGGVPKTFDRIDTNLTDAKCAPDGSLWIHRPRQKGYPGFGNYHLVDYSLFYMNIRENVKQRVEQYLRTRSN